MSEGFASCSLRDALRWYTGNIAYLTALARGGPRIDLDGKEAGTVTPAEAEHARERLRDLALERQRLKVKRPEPGPVLPPLPRPAPLRHGLAQLREAAGRRRQTAGS